MDRFRTGFRRPANGGRLRGASRRGQHDDRDTGRGVPPSGIGGVFAEFDGRGGGEAGSIECRARRRSSGSGLPELRAADGAARPGRQDVPDAHWSVVCQYFCDFDRACQAPVSCLMPLGRGRRHGFFVSAFRIRLHWLDAAPLRGRTGPESRKSGGFGLISRCRRTFRIAILRCRKGSVAALANSITGIQECRHPVAYSIY